MSAAKPQMKRYNGFNVLFDYVGQDDEPCMALGNPINRSSYIIPLDSAYKYADSKTGEPTGYLVTASMQIAKALGLFPDKATCFRIAEAVVDNLPDLIEMPPKAVLTAKQMEKEIEKAGLVVNMNGEKLIDAG